MEIKDSDIFVVQLTIGIYLFVMSISIYWCCFIKYLRILVFSIFFICGFITILHTKWMKGAYLIACDQIRLDASGTYGSLCDNSVNF
ncbi:MAG: hypothetical protein Dasosvirus3_27 [Dasosvirus sp.]|uniref:Uncharacterized protein n=1 Tax=Dasosvirus sp. TaxID=2487764 RepID=A0A3G4ZRD9_9VIRU|nr:MAG: hypothetical protein Dasosvirus3_27 [Dasosvirus sp.]